MVRKILFVEVWNFSNSFKIPFSIDWRHEKPCVQQACKHYNAQQASRSNLNGVMEVLSNVFENRRDPPVTSTRRRIHSETSKTMQVTRQIEVYRLIVTVIFTLSQMQEGSASDREETEEWRGSQRKNKGATRANADEIQQCEEQETVKQVRSDIGRIAASTLIRINCRHIDF
jgi:hypothetical protein